MKNSTTLRAALVQAARDRHVQRLFSTKPVVLELQNNLIERASGLEDWMALNDGRAVRDVWAGRV